MIYALWFNTKENAWNTVVLVDTKLIEAYGDVMIAIGNELRWVKYSSIVVDRVEVVA